MTPKLYSVLTCVGAVSSAFLKAMTRNFEIIKEKELQYDIFPRNVLVDQDIRAPTCCHTSEEERGHLIK